MLAAVAFGFAATLATLAGGLLALRLRERIVLIARINAAGLPNIAARLVDGQALDLPLADPCGRARQALSAPAARAAARGRGR